MDICYNKFFNYIILDIISINLVSFKFIQNAETRSKQKHANASFLNLGKNKASLEEPPHSLFISEL